MVTELNREVRQIASHGEWLRWHDQYVTASAVAALFDCHSFVDRVQLAARMRGLAGTSTSSVPDNAAMKRGRRFEPAVAAAVAEEKPGWELTKADTFHLLPTYRLGCTPDYWCRDGTPDAITRDGLVQCKTVAPIVWEKWGGRPPLMYLLQTLTELLCTDREWGALACLVMGGSFPVHIFNVPRHPQAEQRVLDAVQQFWASLDEGAPMPFAASTEGLDELLDDGSVVDLSGDNELPALLSERELLHTQVKHEEIRLKNIDDAIKAKIGAAARGHLPGWSISFKAQTRKETIIPERTFRTLRIRRSRDEEEVEDAR